MDNTNKKTVNVAVGIILDGLYCFVTKRDEAVHQGGKWEFPGGKVEQGEEITEALARELQEEVGIKIKGSQPFMRIEHDYGDKHVTLHIHIVSDFAGVASGCEGQLGQWILLKDLHTLRFPEANHAIIKQLVAHYL